MTRRNVCTYVTSDRLSPCQLVFFFSKIRVTCYYLQLQLLANESADKITPAIPETIQYKQMDRQTKLFYNYFFNLSTTLHFHMDLGKSCKFETWTSILFNFNGYSCTLTTFVSLTTLRLFLNEYTDINKALVYSKSAFSKGTLKEFLAGSSLRKLYSRTSQQ